MQGPYFKDREEAGRKLAKKLSAYKKHRPLVLGIPRGGIVCAFEVADVLEAPLDTVVVRRLGVFQDRYYAVGALAPQNIIAWNNEALEFVGLSEDSLRELVQGEQESLYNDMMVYRPGLSLKLPEGSEMLIVVDDAVLPDRVMNAALAFLKKQNPGKDIVVATPIIDKTALKDIPSGIIVEALHMTEGVYTPAACYGTDGATDDEIVRRLRERQSL